MGLNSKTPKHAQPYLQPKEIVTSLGFGYAFGKHEVEVSAERLIDYLVFRGQGWESFSLSHMMRYYEARLWNPDEVLFGLIGPYYDDGGMGRVQEPKAWLVHTGSAIYISQAFRVAVSRPTQKEARA